MGYIKIAEATFSDTGNPLVRFFDGKVKELQKEVAIQRKTRRISSIPFWEKSTLSLEEAAEYSGIGIHKLRKLADARNCQFVLWNGNRRLIKRRKFDEFLDDSFSI